MSILQGKENVNKQRNYGMNLHEIIDKLRKFGDVENVMKFYYEIITNPNDYAKLPQPIVYYLFQYIDLLIRIKKSFDDDYFETLLTKSLYQYPDHLGNYISRQLNISNLVGTLKKLVTTTIKGLKMLYYQRFYYDI